MLLWIVIAWIVAAAVVFALLLLGCIISRLREIEE